MTDLYAKYTRLRFDRPHPRVLRITMDNGKMNTADNALHGELAEIWRDIDRDPEVNVAILTGAGKVFSAGGDFAMIQENINDFAARARQWRGSEGDCLQPDQLLETGGQRHAWRRCWRGTGLRHTGGRFDREQRLPDHRRSHAIGSRRRRPCRDHLAITVRIWRRRNIICCCRAEQVLGEEAERIGLISLAVDDAELDAKALEVATKLAEGAPVVAIRWTKYALNNWLRAMGPTFDASLALEFLGFGGPEVKA